MLRFEQVSFRYPGTENLILDNLSFRILPGEFVCLLGPSGCGKSTVLRLINKLEKPQSGRISVDGENVDGLRSVCGYMPQNDLLLPWRSVEDNVLLPLKVQGGLTRAEMRKRAEEALDAVGLSAWAGKLPSALSGGMRQRAAFARTLLTGSRLLLLDEPFSALDYMTRLSLREWLLNQWQREKKTVLFITHDVEEAVFLSSRVLVAESAPLRTLQSVEVPLPYPRGTETLGSSVFTEIRQGLIRRLLHTRA